MKFKNISIENYRNFENISINLENKNIVFGLNDIGKTNFLYAIRSLLDKEYRKVGMTDSDFYQKDTSREIVITLEVDITDKSDNDNKKIRRHMGGAITSTTPTSVFFQLRATYTTDSIYALISLFWGSDNNFLEAIPSIQSYYEIDKLFNIIYIDSSIQLASVFKRHAKDMFQAKDSLSDTERDNLKKTVEKLNNNISKLNNIKSLERDIVAEYNNYRIEKELSIAIKSEVELDNLSSKLTPYICYGSGKTYPTSGDGRKKILAYTLLSLENRKYENSRINIFLIEELENHLHRSMQIALSHQIFTDKIFQYMFLTTHSSLIVSQMDNVNLIKLYKKDKTDGKSLLYKVPEKYRTVKQKLNQYLADAIYADTVLMVEGPSERILFETIMSYKCNDFEAKGGYILEVNGINFVDYYNVLHPLDVNILIKTDNDLKLNKKKNEFNYLGLNRGLSILKSPKLSNENYTGKQFDIDKFNIQRDIYDNTYKAQFDMLQTNNIYMSRIDLENDLYDVIPSKMDEFIKNQNTSKNAVEYMQDAKMINMIELCHELKPVHINKIFNSDLFKCVKELCKLCNQ